ncbi:MAG: DUF2232 domain-containing protein, partial [bacterium]|nr:DUF2232 domain-containing protein [bacterium]
MSEKPWASFLILSLGGLALYGSGLFIVLTPLPFLYYWRRVSSLLFWGGILFSVFLLGQFCFWLGPLSGRFSFLLFLPGFSLIQTGGVFLAAGFTISYFIFYVLIGLLLSEGFRKSWSLTQIFSRILALLIAYTVVLLLAHTFFSGTGPVASLRAYLFTVFEQFLSLQQKGRIPAEDLEFIRQNKETLVESFLHLLPSFFVVGTLILTWINLLVGRRFPPFRKRPIKLTGWFLEDKWIWGLIGLGALYFINLYTMNEPNLG